MLINADINYINANKNEINANKNIIKNEINDSTRKNNIDYIKIN